MKSLEKFEFLHPPRKKVIMQIRKKGVGKLLHNMPLFKLLTSVPELANIFKNFDAQHKCLMITWAYAVCHGRPKSNLDRGVFPGVWLVDFFDFSPHRDDRWYLIWFDAGAQAKMNTSWSWWICFQIELVEMFNWTVELYRGDFSSFMSDFLLKWRVV